jgi:hypothetical protein
MVLCKFSITIAATTVFAVSALAQSPTCDETLWKHVYNPSRLVVQEKCVTVTGTIVDATAGEKIHQKDGVRHEPDGDTHGWLKLDPGQEKFVNDVNKRDEQGNLIFEIVCMYPIPRKQVDARAACAGFKNAVKLPPVGSHVTITGTWVSDLDHGGWLEIHPVTSIVVKK